MIKILKQQFDPAAIFERVKKMEQAILLESQNHDKTLSEMSLIVFNPQKSICYENNILYVDNEIIECDPLDYIEAQCEIDNSNLDIEFNGGFVGAISYDYGLDILNVNSRHISKYPKIIGGIYNQAIIFDHINKVTKIYTENNNLQQILAILNDNQEQPCKEKQAKVKPKLLESDEDYNQKIGKIKNYIKAGDVYEINYTIPFKEPKSLNSWQLYKDLKITNPVPFAAYLNFPNFQLVSTSPELFYKSNNHQIFTQPMKGTAPRSNNLEIDHQNYQLLVASEKDKSELLMIIDLMRNDISKIAKPHSVKVKNPFLIKKYPTVYQQVADVYGELQEDISFAAIIRSLFPSGSITGAPKKRSVEVIDELEIDSRNFYTGAIGFFAKNRRSAFNVAIRTIVVNKDEYQFSVGGAIVWDSKAENEYQECHTKAKAIKIALGADDDNS